MTTLDIVQHRALLTLEPIRALSAAEQQALSRAVRHYQAFLDKPIILAETEQDHQSTLSRVHIRPAHRAGGRAAQTVQKEFAWIIPSLPIRR